MSENNGTALPPGLPEKLVHLLTEGYVPSIPQWAIWLMDGQTMPQLYLFREVEIMLIHPVVRNALNCFKGAIAGAEFEGPKGMDGVAKPISENQALADFVYSMCRRWWNRGMPKAQNGYEYGWIGLENLYSEVKGGDQDGLLQWDGVVDFQPRDCFLLTQNSVPVGVRIKNVKLPDGPASTDRDLWFAEGHIPAKGLWYCHKPRYNRFYGQSQLLGAWKPWRRLAWKDAAETVVDGGFYRQGYGGPIIRYPEEDYGAQIGSIATTPDSSGLPRRYARDEARQISQWAKAGAGIGLPSSCYPSDMGGKPKWDFEWADTHFNGEPLLAYINYLIKMVREGVGVPNELVEASETGSGYSGRAIPLEGFLQQQQEIANALLDLFVSQVLRPLVLWNRAYFEQFGTLEFEVCVANLLETKLKAAMNPGGAAAQNRADGTATAGADEGGGDQGAAGDGTQWSPHQDEKGKQGWKSTGGLVRYTQTPPGGGMSLSAPNPIEWIAKRVLELSKRAA